MTDSFHIINLAPLMWNTIREEKLCKGKLGLFTHFSTGLSCREVTGVQTETTHLDQFMSNNSLSGRSTCKKQLFPIKIVSNSTPTENIPIKGSSYVVKTMSDICTFTDIQSRACNRFSNSVRLITKLISRSSNRYQKAIGSFLQLRLA